MCYMKNGKLHEEKYVGSGLRKKILDRDVTECEFTPPQRASYLHIQAVGGGGGGGDSGYTGGDLKVFTSETEVISPFGINKDMLKLKGISEGELSAYGGMLYAYANAKDKLGDAGKGGDIYHIKQDCGNGSCLVNREWEYTGTQMRKCNCDDDWGWVSYTVKECEYKYDCDKTCSDVYSSYPSCPTDYTCNTWEKDYCYNKSDCGTEASVDANGYCYNSSTYKDPCSGPTCDKCDEYEKDADGNNTSTCISGTNNVKYCTYGYTYTGKCTYGTYTGTCYDDCTDTISKPYSADCDESNYQMLPVETKDTYASYTPPGSSSAIENPSSPPIRFETSPPDPQLTAATAMKEREMLRDVEKVFTICNYGNTSKFLTGDGIFGSFAEGFDPVNVGCDTNSLKVAFGDDMMFLGTSQTSRAEVETKTSSDVYGEKIMYDRSEEEEGAYGKTCRYSVDGDCGTSVDVNGGTYKPPISNPPTYKPYKSLPTSCTYTPSNNRYGTTSSYGCSGKDVISCSTSYPSEYVARSCSCERDQDNGSECMYSYDVNNSNHSKDKRCMYYAEKIEGGTQGLGTQCITGEVDAGTGLQYQGYSSVVPGINGSDKNCTGGSYKSLYSEAEWKAQPQCFAENGTASQGSAFVSLGGNACTANFRQPTEGHGARKCKTGPLIGELNPSTGVPGSFVSTVEEGEDAPVQNPTKCGEANSTFNQYGNGELEKVGSVTEAEGCGKNHVGYCLKHRTDKNPNVTAEEYGKYTYYYTWNTNYLQYGNGGKAGEYRTMIIRSFKDRSMKITIGQGGAAGNCNGQAGGDTVVGDILVAKGGAGGSGCIPTATEQLPTWFEDGTFVNGVGGTAGEDPKIDNFKANVMNLVLPVDNTVLGQWLAASGRGGDGGGSTNRCWASEWRRWFEGEQLDDDGGLRDEAQMQAQGCRKGTYWDALPAPTAGTAGAVLIRW